MKCCECVYWKYIDKEAWNSIGKKMGECRRTSPFPIFIRHYKDIDVLQKYPMFPLMGCDDWCGEFKSKEKVTLWSKIKKWF